MKIAGLKIITIAALIGALAGCDTSQGLGRVFAGDPNKKAGPDEFAIVPTKPLVLPDDFAALPDPTPGGRNLTDLQPEHDAVAALGGQPSRLDSTRVGAGEGAIVAAAERNGTAANIREILAQEDKAVQKKNRPKLLERWFKTDVTAKAYKKETLEARRENELLRRKGVKTPSVAPNQ